jgi:hypothetical protein
VGLQSMVDKYCTVQDALVWTRKPASSTGKPEYNLNPTAITCRWDSKQVNIIGRDGRVVTSNAVILTPTRVEIGSLIFLGTLADWRALPTYPKHPNPLQGGFEVIAVNHSPDFQGEELLYSIFV